MHNANPDRKKDESQERIINDFLMKHYFGQLFQNAKLIDDAELQQAGVDVVCDTKYAQGIKVDIKAQSSARYINHPVPTFSLEVTTLDRYGEREITGWFFSANSKTEYYTFVWIHRANTDEKNRIRSVDDIERVEVLTVDAHALQDYIDDVLDENNLYDIYDVSQDMRWREKTKIPVTDGIHYCHSTHLVEKPVNLVVQKHILEQFAIPGKAGHCFVCKGDIFLPKKRY